MSWVAVGGAAASIGGSALSGAFGGSGDPGPSSVLQNSRADALNQSGRYLDAFYGSNWRGGAGPASAGAWDWVNNGDPSSFSNFRYGDGTNGRAGTTAAGNGSASSLAGGTTPFGNLPILQQMYQAMGAGLNENARTLNDFNTGAEQGYREAAKYGTGQNAVIESDAAKSLQDANAQSLARLNGMGLGGSTLAADQFGGNAAANLREKSRAKANVADTATGFRLQQRNQATAGRAALQQSLNSSNQNLRQMPITGQLNALGSPIANPFSVQGGQAPQQPRNGALQQIGNTASGLGGLFLANQLYGGRGAGSSGGGNPGGPLGW